MILFPRRKYRWGLWLYATVFCCSWSLITRLVWRAFFQTTPARPNQDDKNLSSANQHLVWSEVCSHKLLQCVKKPWLCMLLLYWVRNTFTYRQARGGAERAFAIDKHVTVGSEAPKGLTFVRVHNAVPRGCKLRCCKLNARWNSNAGLARRAASTWGTTWLIDSRSANE